MKTEQVFILENASWPVLLVDLQGAIRKASQGAVAAFGPAISSGSTMLSSIWGNANESGVEQLLANVNRLRAFQCHLNLRVKGGNQAAFNGFACAFSRDELKYFVLQLFADSLSGAPANKETSLDASRPVTVMAGAASPANDPQRHKLECALQLARSVSLDFNNALTTILGHTSHVLSQMPPDHAWRLSVLEVEKAVERAAEIAHDLASFSRQEREQPALQPANLGLLLRRMADLFQRSTANPSAITWRFDLESRLYGVNFDEAKMQQALTKLLENAVEAIQTQANAGKPATIYIRCRNRDLSEASRDHTVQLAPGNYVLVEIQDDGPGIAPDVLPRVFEPFFTTKAGHRGLGLALAYGVITNHGGSLTITSEPGQGTSVRIYLPATPKVVMEAPSSDEELRGSETILLVDDEELLLTMGQVVLSSYGYKVLTANSGLKALEIVGNTETPIDLVITDLVMPRMGGRELAEHLHRAAPHLKIIFSSGYVRPERGDEVLYLQKPFTSRDLLAKVKQALTS